MESRSDSRAAKKVSTKDAARMKATIDSLPFPKRSGRQVLIEWLCEHCGRWYVWPHSYPAPTHLRKAFKWRVL